MLIDSYMLENENETNAWSELKCADVQEGSESVKSNIFVPKRINVGFQERSSTYTGKLAYVIYYDEKGTLRKEKSWNGWRNKEIPNEEFDNVPTEGFVLNKHVGGYASGWEHRNSYCRVYDPRNFEFEISIENLLYILECCDSIKGKGLQGEFVYAWDGVDLLLLPIESPDYKEIAKYNQVIHANECIKAKDLIVGATYLNKNNEEIVYIGKFEKYTRGLWKNGHFFKSYNAMYKWCGENNVRADGINSFYYTTTYKEDRYDYGIAGKMHCFCQKNKEDNGEFTYKFDWLGSLGKNIIGVVNETCCPEYAEMFYALEGESSYSPPDNEKSEYVEMSYEDFEKLCVQTYGEDKHYGYGMCRLNYHGKIVKCDLKPDIMRSKDAYRVYRCNEGESRFYHSAKIPILDVFPTTTDREEYMIPVTLREIYDKMHPVYKQRYLINGRKWRKEYNWYE